MLSCISETLGDLITVGSDGETSCVRLHSINGVLVANLDTQRVTAITSSSAPEGTSVNVIAAALADFTIQSVEIFQIFTFLNSVFCYNCHHLSQLPQTLNSVIT